MLCKCSDHSSTGKLYPFDKNINIVLPFSYCSLPMDKIQHVIYALSTACNALIISTGVGFVHQPYPSISQTFPVHKLQRPTILQKKRLKNDRKILVTGLSFSNQKLGGYGDIHTVALWYKGIVCTFDCNRPQLSLQLCLQHSSATTWRKTKGNAAFNKKQSKENRWVASETLSIDIMLGFGWFRYLFFI